MPMREDWKDFVTDDVTLVFDLDSPCYMAASAHETDVLIVTHKASGREVFKVKDKPIMKKVCVNPETQDPSYVGTEKTRLVDQDTGETENIRFKNKTDFQGRTKKVATGWLGDLNKKRVAEGKPTFAADEFELTTEKELTGELSWAINGLNSKIQRITDYLGISRVKHVIGSGDNHRHLLHLPINPNKTDQPERGRYKGNREPSLRPLLLEDVRDYAVRRLGAEEVTGIETDDVMNFYMWESHMHYKKTGKHKYIIISPDKDTYMFNGMAFNNYVLPKQKEWSHPYPYLIDGMGYIDFEGSKLKGDGILFCMGMMMVGDSADNWLPTRHSKISFGAKDAYTLLHDKTTPLEAIQATYDQYLAWYPEGTQFTSWDGKEMDLTALEWLDMMWAAAYMLKSRKDTLTFTQVMDKVGAVYEK
tara:strand:+ start:778 stop:2031 length:1254 start_codon:yes stop_codon:yes gene_type:complete